MSRYGVEIVPFQHGYERELYRCWALVWDHPCRNRAQPVLGNMKLCGRHMAQLERNGFHIVRLSADQLQTCLDNLAAEERAEAAS